MSLLKLGSLSTAVLCVACATLAQPDAPLTTPSAAPTATASTPTPAGKPSERSAANGRKLYGSYCTRCHGVNMVSVGSGFYDLRSFPSDQKERFVQSVSKGLRAMPAWESSLKPQEIDDLWAYVLSGRGQ